MKAADLSPGLVYRAEGNANMVVSIQGTGLVIRLFKKLLYDTELVKNKFVFTKMSSSSMKLG